MIRSISDIKYSFYINLEERKDCKEHVEKQLASVNLPIERFNAIKLENGTLGCSMSHLVCLEIAKDKGWPHVLICEDDIEFLNPPLFTQQLNSFLEKRQNEWDVVLLAGNNVSTYTIPENDDTCIQVSHCQTTTGYLVKSDYFDKLIHNIKEGSEMLSNEQYNHYKYAIDQYWRNLQEIDKWYLIVPLTVTQRQDYSNIENGYVDYTPYLLSLDMV
jgi:glycosyl transferase family 25